MNIEIDIYGHCPVQGEGTINGMPFYFRARHGLWTMTIDNDPVEAAFRGAGREWAGVYENASWMDHAEARAIIEKCAKEYAGE